MLENKKMFTESQDGGTRSLPKSVINTVPCVDALEERHGFALDEAGNIYLLLGLPQPVSGPAFVPYGCSCIAAYVVRTLPNENVPYGPVQLAVWKNKSRFNNGERIDGLIDVASLLARNNTCLKKTWLRLGVSVYMKDEEAEKIMGDCDTGTLREILADGRWRPDGEAYIPGETVEGYNAENGTSFKGEPEFCL